MSSTVILPSRLCAVYNDSVRDIYSAVVAGLALNPARRFSPEISVFMAKWWSDPLVTDAQVWVWGGGGGLWSPACLSK